MADNDKNIQIAITTTADTSGAEQAEAALKRVSSVEDFKRMADHAGVAKWAFYDLDKGVRIVDGAVEKFGTSQDKAGKSSRNLGMAANALSYQMQDFTVQVGAGQSAVTAFAQQAPQLIDGLRMAGVMSGPVGMSMMAVAAVLPIVAFGGKKIAESFGESAEAAKKFAEETKKLQDASTKLIGEDLDERVRKINFEADTAGKLATKWSEVGAASNNYTNAVLSNAEKHEMALRKIADALGVEYDKMLAIERLEKLKEARILEKARQELEKEQLKIKELEEELGRLNDEIHAKEALADAERQKVALAENRLSKAIDEQTRLRKIIAKAPNLLDVAEDLSTSNFQSTRALDARAAGQEAQKRLDKIVDPEIDGANKILTEVLPKLKAMAGEAGEIATMEVDFEAKKIALEKARNDFKVNEQRVGEDIAQNLEDLRTAALEEKGKLIIGKIKEVTSNLSTNNAPVKAEVDTLVKSTDDAILNQKELMANAKTTNNLIAEIHGGLVTATDGNNAKVLEMLKELTRIQMSYAQELENVKGQIKGLR